MRKLMLLALVVLLLGLVAVPAAAGPPDLSEERISLLCGFDPFPPCIAEFPAETPFWIGHGVAMGVGQGTNHKGDAPAVGHFDFKLFVDGVEVSKDWTFHGLPGVFNVLVFPEGMTTGEVTFTGVWYDTCTLDDVGEVEGCDKPSDTRVFLTEFLVVDFV